MCNVGIVAEIARAASAMSGFECREIGPHRAGCRVIRRETLHTLRFVNDGIAKRIYRRGNLRRVIGHIDRQIAVQRDMVAVAIRRENQRTEIKTVDRAVGALKSGVVAIAADMVELVIEIERIAAVGIEMERENRTINQRLIVGIRESRNNGLVDVSDNRAAVIDHGVAQLAVVRRQPQICERGGRVRSK